MPNWDSLDNEPVQILIDVDNDGTPDDTISVANQATEVRDSRPTEIPKEFSLSQNYPNPFNASTRILFTIPKRTLVDVSVYNAMGQRVRVLLQLEMPAGKHMAKWDGRDHAGHYVSSGVYTCQLKAGEQVFAIKMLLIK
jgi:hypothetical protein